jgi:DNA-binding LytR/AlgR family response regulator
MQPDLDHYLIPLYLIYMKILIAGEDLSSAGVIRQSASLFSQQPVIKSVSEKEVLSGDTLQQDELFDLFFLNAQLYEYPAVQRLLKEQDVSHSVVFLTGNDGRSPDRLSSDTFFSCISRPVNPECVDKVIKKYVSLRKHFQEEREPSAFFKGINRIVGKRGYEFFNIPIGEVACFYTEKRAIYFVTRKGQKYLSEFNSLGELYASLDKKYFNRINRKHIVSLAAIRKFRSFERLKIIVELEIEIPGNLVVSQGNASFFRKWVRQQ